MHVTWIILLKISSKKNTKWWLVGAEKRNHGVLNASNKCSNFVLATMDSVLRYGETLTRIVNKQSNSGCSLWWPVVMILWNTVTKRSACVPEIKLFTFWYWLNLIIDHFNNWLYNRKYKSTIKYYYSFRNTTVKTVLR